ILLEDLIDLVEDRLHVVAELLLAFLDLLASLRGRVLGLFAAPGGLSLAASVLRCHTVPPWSWASSLPSTVSSPASSQSTPRRGQRSPSRWPRTEIRQVGPGSVLLPVRWAGSRSAASGERGDQVGGGAAAVDQLAHVRPGAPEGFQGRHALQRIVAGDVKDHRVPRGGGHGIRVLLQAPPAEVGPRVARGLL